MFSTLRQALFKTQLYKGKRQSTAMRYVLCSNEKCENLTENVFLNYSLLKQNDFQPPLDCILPNKKVSLIVALMNTCREP